MTTIPTPTCSFEWSGYPHPGAAEFGEPDHWSCSAAATWAISYSDEQWSPDGEPAMALSCDEHLRDMTEGADATVAPIDADWRAEWDRGALDAQTRASSMTWGNLVAWSYGDCDILNPVLVPTAEPSRWDLREVSLVFMLGFNAVVSDAHRAAEAAHPAD